MAELVDAKGLRYNERMKRLSRVKIEWSPSFAYAIGLIVTDGSLSRDGRHIDFTSKDKGLIISFQKCFGLKNKIGKKTRDRDKIKKYYRVQFGDKNFYEFLLSIGLMPNKSKRLRDLKIGVRYFADFLRGCIDGDGNLYSFRHPESQYAQIRVRIASASLPFLEWLHRNIKRNLGLKGGWIETGSGAWLLSFGKNETLELLRQIYYSQGVPCLERKERIARRFMRV